MAEELAGYLFVPLLISEGCAHSFELKIEFFDTKNVAWDHFKTI
jgi:hypothetical protein